MSRTDIHRPVWVMLFDPTVRHWFRDFHHHPRGWCDLDRFLTEIRLDHPRYPRTHCSRIIWTQCPNICGCPMCTGRPGRRRDRKLVRHNVRQQLHHAVRVHDWDVDIPSRAYPKNWF